MNEGLKALLCSIFTAVALTLLIHSIQNIFREPQPAPGNFYGISAACVFALLAIAWRPK